MKAQHNGCNEMILEMGIVSLNLLLMVSLALVIAIALMGRVEYAVFAVVYFLTQVPLMLVAVMAYRRLWSPRP